MDSLRAPISTAFSKRKRDARLRFGERRFSEKICENHEKTLLGVYFPHEVDTFFMFRVCSDNGLTVCELGRARHNMCKKKQGTVLQKRSFCVVIPIVLRCNSYRFASQFLSFCIAIRQLLHDNYFAYPKHKHFLEHEAER